MKKNVPDPPIELSKISTVNTPFGESQMFSIREGISGEEALLYACHLLQSAEASVLAAACNLELADRALVTAAGHHIEAARALVDAVIDGAGVQRLFSF